MYTDYLAKKYGEAIVVFDGYDKSSATKIWCIKDEPKGVLW